jgi:PPOX class probable F420-dependent enzyme
VRTQAIPAEVERFLRRQRVARLATANHRGRPHVVPICFAVSGTTLFTVIDRKPKRVGPTALRRVRNVRQNPRVAAVIDVYAEDWSKLGFVLLEGRARIVQRGTAYTIGLNLLRRKYPQYRRMDLQNCPMIVVTIQIVVGWGHSGGQR